MDSHKIQTYIERVYWALVVVYSNDLSSNPVEVYSFYSVKCLKRTKINKKRLGMAHFLETYIKLCMGVFFMQSLGWIPRFANAGCGHLKMFKWVKKEVANEVINF